MRLHARTKHNRHGTVLIYVTAAMAVFIGLVSLAVDVSHVRVVKNQLQGAADAAVRYAAKGFQTSVATARSNAVTAGADNTADGSAVVIDPNNDVQFGTWDSTNGTFTVLSGASQSSANAIRVYCRRTVANGNPVRLWFGGLIGKSSSDVTVQAIASSSSSPLAGIIGLSSVTFKNNTFIGSYNSSNNKSPSQGSAGSSARVGTNGSITAGNNSTIHGDAVLGPGATVSGPTVTGSQLNQGSALPTSTLPAWSPGVNPNNVPQAYTVSSNTVLPGGTYWFTSLTLNANLTFSGPATLYVNGNVVVDGTLAPVSNVPGDLTIYQYGSNTFGDSGGNGMTITANVLAPGSDFTAKNNLDFYGQAIFNTITTKNNANFYYDLALGPADGSAIIATLQ